LLRTHNISTKENKAARLKLFETSGSGGVEFRTGDTGEEKLAEGHEEVKEEKKPEI
jgi:hypothetical protein